MPILKERKHCWIFTYTCPLLDCEIMVAFETRKHARSYRQRALDHEYGMRVSPVRKYIIVPGSR